MHVVKTLLLDLAAMGLLLAACPKTVPNEFCDSVADCRSNEVCIEGVCHQTCNYQADCRGHERCFDGYCVDAIDSDAGLIADARIDDAYIDDAHVDDAHVDDAADPDANIDPQCSGQPDMTSCRVITDPDRDFDVCIDEICVSPGCGDSSCNLPQTFPLADTGQMTCYGVDSALATCPGTAGAEACATTHYCGQDAQYGDGSLARFSRDLSTADEPTVSDSISGLMWQGCVAGQSGGNCATGTATSKTWSDALAYCDGLDWGGHDDWHLPSHLELLSIVNDATYNPAIDQSAFPATPYTSSENDGRTWTSSTCAWDVSSAWIVNFINGYDNVSSVSGTDYDYVRCVRPVASSARAAQRYLRSEPVTGQPVVNDAVTGLMWQGCAMGQSGSLCTGGSASKLPWKSALAYCEGLNYDGHDDWRLPNFRELLSITEDRWHDTAIDQHAFPGTPTSGFLSSTTYAPNVSHAWSVDFYFGSDDSSHKAVSHCVRCVRLGP